MATHIGLRAIGLLIDKCEALQKLIQRRVTAVEGVNGILPGQFTN
jgi:hypothetical protein